MKRIVFSIIGVIFVLFGGLWILQGANILAGSAMSGQNQWLIIGIIALIAGLVLLWIGNRRSNLPL